jgi:hypothetical protein
MLVGSLARGRSPSFCPILLYYVFTPKAAVKTGKQVTVLTVRVHCSLVN